MQRQCAAAGGSPHSVIGKIRLPKKPRIGLGLRSNATPLTVNSTMASSTIKSLFAMDVGPTAVSCLVAPRRNRRRIGESRQGAPAGGRRSPRRCPHGLATARWDAPEDAVGASWRQHRRSIIPARAAPGQRHRYGIHPARSELGGARHPAEHARTPGSSRHAQALGHRRDLCAQHHPC